MKRNSVKYKSPTLIIGLCLTGLLGVTILATKGRQWSSSESRPRKPKPTQVVDLEAPSNVLALVGTDSPSRDTELLAIAVDKSNKLEQSRAKYLLAMSALEAYDGGTALDYLENLERNYPVLAPHILIKRGRAYELSNNTSQAQVIWLQVLQDYPDSPAAAEALYRLSPYGEQYIEQAIAQYPAHPRTQALIRAELEKNPDQLKLWILRLLHDADAYDIGTVRGQLTENYADQLTPEVWEALGDSYWDGWQYDDAAKAYEKAPKTSRNLYRVGRGFHIKDQNQNARRAYLALIETFPDAEETGLGLRRLASLVGSNQAIAYLDQAHEKFPKEAAQALLSKADILDRLGSRTSAEQARQIVLNNYKTDDATSDYRWQRAEQYAKEGRSDKAWEWAQPIAKDTPNHTNAAESVYWIGKWAARLNRPEDAAQAYMKVLADYPESYYAWRSAVQLGWDVGSFTSVRNLQPPIIIPKERPLPPAGSETFQELFRLGQDFDAWNELQTDLAEKPDMTVAEEFTWGLLKLSQGRYLKGINTIWNLSQRDGEGDRQAWLELRQRPDYWYALFPFPYAEQILKHSADNQLNPLLVVSLMRQESRFEKEIQSPVGATGLMQVMPATGQWISDQINDSEYSLTNPEDNIQFGTWYLRYTHREYDDNSMLAIASYNAGPGNVAKWVRRYDLSDPDMFVEQIPFKETKGYVSSVFANYWNYQRLYNPDLQSKLQALSPQ